MESVTRSRFCRSRSMTVRRFRTKEDPFLTGTEAFWLRARRSIMSYWMRQRCQRRRNIWSRPWTPCGRSSGLIRRQSGPTLQKTVIHPVIMYWRNVRPMNRLKALRNYRMRKIHWFRESGLRKNIRECIRAIPLPVMSLVLRRTTISDPMDSKSIITMC